MPARAIRIFLVRHGQSEANLDKTVNLCLPDHQIALSPQGREQAEAAGRFLAQTLARDSRVRILCSPYMRARQTSERIPSLPLRLLVSHKYTGAKRSRISPAARVVDL
jgi:phosphohistidine phosphatase SixA